MLPNNAIGQMKANKEGTKIALAIHDADKIELFDFNPFTGIVSNWQTPSMQIFSPYGVEFSADGTKLYCSVDKFNQLSANLLQFNLTDPAGLDAVYPLYSGQLKALQIGPDDKIYCNAGTNYLGVVNDPDSVGLLCNFNKNDVSLNGNIGAIGLPNMIITSRKLELVETGPDTIPCFGDILIIGESPVAGMSYLWQNGSTNSTLKVSMPGKYTLIIKSWNSKREVMFNVHFKDCNPVIPNIITPNRDKLNDAFILKNLNAANFELQIFNRWGSLIYQTKSYQNDWDARENSAGLYYYLLRNSETGTTFKGWLEVVK
jgi:gliding motility-associated-like protein